MAAKKKNWRTTLAAAGTALCGIGTALATTGTKWGAVASVVVLAVGGLITSLFAADSADVPEAGTKK